MKNKRVSELVTSRFSGYKTGLQKFEVVVGSEKLQLYPYFV